MEPLRSDAFSTVLWHTLDAYSRNFKLLVTVSLPFLIVFPLALFLPNFTSLGAIFLRFGSVSKDLPMSDMALIAIAYVFSLLLFSFALVAINMVIKSERTLNQVKVYDFEKIERYTVQLFTLFLVVFVLSLIVNMFLYERGLHTTLGALVALVLSLLVVFAPQAIVIDNQPARFAPKMSLALTFKKFPYFLAYLIAAVVLLLINGAIFIALSSTLTPIVSQLVAVVVNALLILPFLEVLKAQVYLSKYTLM